VLGSIIAASALWITVASERNVPQSWNNKHDETLRQIAVEKEQLEVKLKEIMYRASQMTPEGDAMEATNGSQAAISGATLIGVFHKL
jgi:hypothetical protein